MSMTLVTTIAPLSDHVVRLKFLSVGNQANIATGAWVVVRDDGKELILKNSGSPAALKLDTKEVHELANAPTHQQGTNQPGRCINRSATHAPRSSRPIGTMKRSAFSSILWPAGSTWRSRRENPAISSSSARRAARARHVVKKQVRSACGSAPDEMLWNLYRCTNTCSLPAVSLPQLLEYPTLHSGRRCRKVPSCVGRAHRRLRATDHGQPSRAARGDEQMLRKRILTGESAGDDCNERKRCVA